MIKRWGTELAVLSQAQWLEYLDDCFSYAVGWRFRHLDTENNEEGIPNYEQLVKIDPVELLSLGEEKLLPQKVDFDKAYIPKEDYGYKDDSDPVPQDRYDQIERLIHLSCLWHVHLKGSGWRKRPIFLPLPNMTCEEVRAKLLAFADEEGLVHEIRAWQEGVPFADILAGYEYAPDPDHFGGSTNWDISFDIFQ